MIVYLFLMVILFHSIVCDGNNFSMIVATLVFISLPHVILKYLCWCMWAVVRCAPGFLILSHMVFASGLITKVCLDNFGWEVFQK